MLQSEGELFCIDTQSWSFFNQFRSVEIRCPCLTVSIVNIQYCYLPNIRLPKLEQRVLHL